MVSPDYQHLDYKEPERLKQLVSSLRTAFPDLHDTIDRVIGEGNWLAYRVSLSGTFKGKYGDMKPTGKELKMTQMLFGQFKADKLVATVPLSGTLAFYQSMGIAPPGYEVSKK